MENIQKIKKELKIYKNLFWIVGFAYFVVTIYFTYPYF